MTAKPSLKMTSKNQGLNDKTSETNHSPVDNLSKKLGPVVPSKITEVDFCFVVDY